MKNLFILTGLFLSSTLFSLGQDIAPAPADKAVVYFVRTSSFGGLVNFTYLDSAKIIGKFNGPKYIRYECEPGNHLLWARSENRDFVEAELEAGKIYFIEAIVKMGGIKAAVELAPVDPKDEKTMSKIFKLLNKKPSESFTPEQLQQEEKEDQEIIAKGLTKYKEDKKKGNTYVHLEKTMAYSN